MSLAYGVFTILDQIKEVSMPHSHYILILHGGPLLSQSLGAGEAKEPEQGIEAIKRHVAGTRMECAGEGHLSVHRRQFW